jgi:RNA polymerase sigma-70 factor (ECF subfamily)
MTSNEGGKPVADDERLMRLLQQGRDDALDQLVRRWEKPMLNYFYRLTGDLDAAEDLRQDLFLRVYVYRDSYRGDGGFRAWLYQTATNQARTYFRREKKHYRVSAIGAEDESDCLEIPADAPMASELVQQQETAQLVRELLAELSPDDREALILRFFERLRYHEISRVLSVAEPTAKSRVYRAVGRLRHKVVARGLTAAELL